MTKAARKVSFPESWPEPELREMYARLKAHIDDGTKAKASGAVKKVHTPRDVEDIVRAVLERKRGVTFRRDTGSCVVAEDSPHAPDRSWIMNGWFSVCKVAKNLLETDVKKARKRAAEEGDSPAEDGGSKRVKAETAPPDKNASVAPPEPGPGPTPGRGKPREPAALPRSMSEGFVEPRPAADGAAGSGAVKREGRDAPPSAAAPTPAANGHALLRTAVRQDLMWDPAEPGDEAAVPLVALTCHGVARLVECALRERDPAEVHWPAHFLAGRRAVAEGLIGRDVVLMDGAHDLMGVIAGPRQRRGAVFRMRRGAAAAGRRAAAPRGALGGRRRQPAAASAAAG
eukprot:jgi/Tetstr1/423050/TSEL_013821.t1